MKNLGVTAFALAATVATWGAQAGEIIDFQKMADDNTYTPYYGEIGFDPFVYIGINFTLTITGSVVLSDGTLVDAHPYLDAGKAGMGVCGTLTPAPGLQCDPSSDDNVSVGEATDTISEVLTFVFSDVVGANNADTVRIENIWLNNTHDSADRNIGSSDTLLVGNDVDFATLLSTDGTPGPNNGYADASITHHGASRTNSLKDIDVKEGARLTIGYGGQSPEQFYVSGMEVDVIDRITNVPAPATLLLLGGGLLGLGLGRRRKRPVS